MSAPSNRFTGTIPTEMGDCHSLKYLILGYNGLGGTIPTEIGRLENLNVVLTVHNSFVGDIPSEMGLLTNLGKCPTMLLLLLFVHKMKSQVDAWFSAII